MHACTMQPRRSATMDIWYRNAPGQTMRASKKESCYSKGMSSPPLFSNSVLVGSSGVTSQ